MPQWTAEQEKVISSDAGKLVCSAAAGSGKTAVMVERVVRMIESGKDPYSFLVITFTNAAAAEMKEKIRKRLLSVRKDPVMEVCTIHAFCQHLIRQEFQIAEVDPLFQICSTAQRESLFEDAFRKACDRLKKNGDREYLSFTEREKNGRRSTGLRPGSSLVRYGRPDAGGTAGFRTDDSSPAGGDVRRV